MTYVSFRAIPCICKRIVCEYVCVTIFFKHKWWHTIHAVLKFAFFFTYYIKVDILIPIGSCVYFLVASESGREGGVTN